MVSAGSTGEAGCQGKPLLNPARLTARRGRSQALCSVWRVEEPEPWQPLLRRDARAKVVCKLVGLDPTAGRFRIDQRRLPSLPKERRGSEKSHRMPFHLRNPSSRLRLHGGKPALCETILTCLVCHSHVELRTELCKYCRSPSGFPLRCCGTGEHGGPQV